MRGGEDKVVCPVGVQMCRERSKDRREHGSSRLQHLPVRAAHRDVGTVDVESENV